MFRAPNSTISQLATPVRSSTLLTAG